MVGQNCLHHCLLLLWLLMSWSPYCWFNNCLHYYYRILLVQWSLHKYKRLWVWTPWPRMSNDVYGWYLVGQNCLHSWTLFFTLLQTFFLFYFYGSCYLSKSFLFFIILLIFYKSKSLFIVGINIMNFEWAIIYIVGRPKLSSSLYRNFLVLFE